MDFYCLKLQDNFMVRNPEEVIDKLEEGCRERLRRFLDWRWGALLFSPHPALFSAVRNCSENNGEIAFPSSCGLNVEVFIELLYFFFLSWAYFSLHWRWSFLAKILVHVSPPPCMEFFLAHCDKSIFENLGGENVFKIFRYVDDYLVIFHPYTELANKMVNGLEDLFASCCNCLRRLRGALHSTWI